MKREELERMFKECFGESGFNLHFKHIKNERMNMVLGEKVVREMDKIFEDRFNKTLQNSEDKSIEHQCRIEAGRLFHEWLNANEIRIGEKSFKNWIYLPSPINKGIYTIYHKESAKFKEEGWDKLIKDEFNKLVNKWNDENTTK